MLEGNVLVLNRSWLAVHVTPVRRALTLLYNGGARAVHPTEYSVHEFDDWLVLSNDGLGGRYVYTPSLRIRVPEVIQLTMFNGFIRHTVRFSRNSIFERDECTCQYCGRRLSRSQLTVDHVIPQSRNGKDTWENLVLACMACNVRKGNRTPEEAGMPLLRRPKKPGSIPHFGVRVPREQLDSWQRFLDVDKWMVEERVGA